MSDHIIFQREFVGVLLSVRSFRVEQGIAVFGLLPALQRQVSLLRHQANVLKGVGMRQRNPNLHRFPNGNTLDREGIVELKMALALGVGGESGEHNEAGSKVAGKHGDILSGETRRKNDFLKRPTGVLGARLK